MLLPVYAQALQLSAAQLQMVQQLPAGEKAKLAAQAGVTLPSPAPKVATTAPVVVQSRTVGTGRIEAQINQNNANESLLDCSKVMYQFATALASMRVEGLI